MWSAEAEELLAEELFRAMRRRRLVFLQWNPSVEAALVSERVASRTTVVEGSISPPAVLEDSPPSLVIFPRFDAVLNDPDPARTLGRARDEINQYLDSGGCVCLVSRVPRMAFPLPPGSSILEDVFVLHADSIVQGRGVLEGPDVCCWPETIDEETLKEGLKSLGLNALAFLDFLLFDLQEVKGIDLGLGTDREWEALRGLGVLRLDQAAGKASVSIPVSGLMTAVADVISSAHDPQPGFADVSERLFSLERRLRWALREKAVRTFGPKWRGQILSEDMGTRAATRAMDETPRKLSVKALRDPFEWLTLGELVELLTSSNWTQGLGRNPNYWRRFATELLPVRNRVSHMRLLRRGDLERVEAWRVLLSKTLDVSTIEGA